MESWDRVNPQLEPRDRLDGSASGSLENQWRYLGRPEQYKCQGEKSWERREGGKRYPLADEGFERATARRRMIVT